MIEMGTGLMCRGEDECRLIGINREGITCSIRDV